MSSGNSEEISKASEALTAARKKSAEAFSNTDKAIDKQYEYFKP